MASCCTGVTECEQLITIGFLNSFIGSDVQNSSGVAQTAAGDNDYCPTYNELTGGTLIQNWKQGTTPNGDRDGIIIGGTYAGNQCVKRSDLSMKYTRFKEFSITAASTTLTACSASTTISYTHKYNRCERKINGTCEAAASDSCTTVNDTQNSEVTLTSSNNVFTIDGFTVKVPKNNPNNNGRSNSRNTTITGKVTFRGTNHTATVKITQNGLTGEYKYWYHTNKVHGKNVSCNGGPTFDCNGGNYSATAYYYQDDWDVYRWRDVCGTDYDSDTEQRNRINNQYKEYDTYSGSFPNNKSTGGPAATDSISWAGYGSCSWSQSYCPPPDCPTCSCNDCDCLVWGYGTYSGTVPCTGGTVYMSNVTVPGTATTYTYNAETSACTVTTAETSTTRSTSVSIGCNTTRSAKTHTGTKNNISYTITQSAGPCCTPNSTTSYTPVYLTCSAHENEAVSSTYTARTTGECCNTSSTTGVTSTYYVTVGCNSGSTRVVSSNAPFTIYQRGDTGCCITCTCDDLTVGKTSETWPYNATTSDTKDITITSANCVTNISLSSPAHFNATLGSGKITVSPKGNNTTTGDYVDTLTVSYNQNCSSSITLTQYCEPLVPCDCDDLTVSTNSIEFAWNDGETSWPPPRNSKYWYAIQSADCVSHISASTTGSDFEIALSNSSLIISPYNYNTGFRDKTDTITITYNNGCSSAITVTQKYWTCNDIDIVKLANQSYTTEDDGWISAALVTSVSGPLETSRLFVGSFTPGIEDYRWNASNPNLLEIKLKAVTEPRYDYFEIGLNKYQFACKEYSIYRACPCAMDDCYSRVTDKDGSVVEVDHILPADPWMTGNNGATAATIDGVTYEIRYANGDALHVPYTALTVDNSQVAPSVFKRDPVTGFRALTHDGWYVQHYENGEMIEIGYDASADQIMYYMPRNFSASRVDYWVDYTVAPGNIMSGGEFDGKKPCPNFRVHIAQAPNGSHYQNSHQRDDKHQVMRYLVPLTSEGSGSCMKPDGTYYPNYNCGVSQLPSSLNPNLSPPFLREIPNGYRIDSNPDGSCPS